MSVTLEASANATPASGTVIATCVIGGENYQLIIPAGTDGAPVGLAPATPFYTSACVTNQAGSAVGSPLFASITNLAGSAAGSPLFTLQTNATGSALTNPTFSSLTNIGGSAIGSPFFVAEVRAAGSAAGSPLFTSACLTNLAGSAAGSPLFTSITNLAGSAAGSPLFTIATNTTGSAAGSPIFSSITNLAGSAAGSPLFTSVTNVVSASISSGSVALLAGANTIGAASVIQSTPNSNANAWPVKVTDGTNIYGVAGSPLANTGEAIKIWWGGSLLTLAQANVFAASAACTAIVASQSGFSTVVVAATFTTSSCQFIGWTACGNGGAASATVQSAMPFGTNGGMDANRLPHGYLWQFPSGSIAVMTTTSACIVAGTINYVRVAS